MGRKHSWLILVVIVMLLVAACGPQMATPTPSEEIAAEDTPTTAPEAPAGETPTAEQEKEPTQAPESPTEAPVAEGGWNVLGSPDATVTIVEFSDFQ